MLSVTTIDAEAARRAKLAGVPPQAVLPWVQAEVLEHPIRLRYETLPHSLDLAEVTFIEGAVWTTLNLRHPFVIDFMLGHHEPVDDEEEGAYLITAEQRSQIEVFLMVILGVRPDLTEEEYRVYQTLHHEVSQRLAVAIPILMEMFDA